MIDYMCINEQCCIPDTFQICQKLAGDVAHNAGWATSVGNEDGQILNTVFTAKEGEGLKAMGQGIVKRYIDAGKPEPQVIYVDRDCCCETGDPLPLKVYNYV